MATRPRSTSTRRPAAPAPPPVAPADAGATPATKAAGARRPGAVRRTKAAVARPAAAPGPSVIAPIAAAPEVHVAAAITPVEERIRVRAYYLHLERQGRPADPVGDWLRAQREIAGGSHDA